jgi:hypothetical protein
MDWQTHVNIPESLRYGDGLYVLERFSRAGAGTSVRDKRIVTRALRALHWPWFAVWMPTGVAELTTTGRKSGRRGQPSSVPTATAIELVLFRLPASVRCG